jgi:phage-related tail fiber protein
LTTRVKSPDVDDLKKLNRVIAYLAGTRELTLTLEATDLNVTKWWIDGSYATHRDMRSHTGGTLSLGRGSVYSTSTRQKLTTKSSTEAELVAVADVLPQVLWTRYFLQEQGYAVKSATIYQDNKSAILLE